MINALLSLLILFVTKIENAILNTEKLGTEYCAKMSRHRMDIVRIISTFEKMLYLLFLYKSEDGNE